MSTNFNKKTFLREKKFITEKNFILIGHICEFRKVGDFKTFNFFDKSIVVYKFKEKLTAFSNICSHRGSKIFLENSGNSKFVCPYHSWTYDYTGKVKTIPFEKKAFKFKNRERAKLKLEKWELEYCGDFIFLKSKKNNTLLKKFLGKSFSKLSKISKKIDEKIDYQAYIWSANWKICIENSIDEYHAIFLHKSTFKNNLDLKPKYDFAKNIMSMRMPLTKNYLKKFHNLKNYFQKLDKNYSHTFIFPISSISNTMENSFYIQNYLPKSLDETFVNSTIYLPKISNKMSNKTKEFFSESCNKFNKIVFLEDKQICENIYSNIKNRKFKDFVGNLEQRIKIFRKEIKKI